MITKEQFMELEIGQIIILYKYDRVVGEFEIVAIDEKDDWFRYVAKLVLLFDESYDMLLSPIKNLIPVEDREREGVVLSEDIDFCELGSFVTLERVYNIVCNKNCYWRVK